MTARQAAIYARVSSERQAEAGTIASQIAALRARAAADGLLLPAAREFVDDGYSGTTLVRPALERLRGLAVGGGLDRLSVQAPDRLARRYAYQVLLVEGLAAAGVEVVFLNRAPGATPEDALLLQVQGVLAEYARALFLERSRRGKRHAAQTGALSARPKAPYGYRDVGRADGVARPAYEVVPEEAQVVRQIFAWVAHERLTLAAVARRLREAGTPTATGKGVWGRSAIWTLLRNTTDAGRAIDGMRRYGPWQPPLRPKRGHAPVPRQATTRECRPADERITIPVPALVDEATFATVQERLEEHRQRARQRLDSTGTRHLLSGLVVCARCGYGYDGIRAVEQRRKTTREYRYDRCRGSDASRQGAGTDCPNRAVYAGELEAAVWREVRQVLEHPERLAAEHQRRLTAGAGQEPGAMEGCARSSSAPGRGWRGSSMATPTGCSPRRSSRPVWHACGNAWRCSMNSWRSNGRSRLRRRNCSRWSAVWATPFCYIVHVVRAIWRRWQECPALILDATAEGAPLAA